MDLPPAHFVKDEMQNRRLIVNGLTLYVFKIGAQSIHGQDWEMLVVYGDGMGE